MRKTRIIGIIAAAAVITAVPVLLGFPVLHGVKSGTTACGVAATRVAAADGFSSLFVDNPNSTSVYIGGSNVTTSNGIAIGTNDGTQYYSTDSNNGEIYCIVASATQTVRHMAGL